MKSATTQEDKPLLYYYPPKNVYFLVGRAICDICNKDITYRGNHITSHNRKKKSYDIFCCDDCIKKYKNRNQYEEYKKFLMAYRIPDGCKPVLITRPQLANSSNLDVFEAADKQIGNEEVIDNTLLSGRESFEGAKIGSPTFVLIDKKDSPVEEEEVEKILEMSCDVGRVEEEIIEKNGKKLIRIRSYDPKTKEELEYEKRKEIGGG